MSAQSVARQYANALYTVAHRAGRTTVVGQDLSAFAALIAGHDELAKLFAAAVVPPKKKRAVVDALLGAAEDLSGEVSRLLTMLADRDRLALVDDIARAYADRLKDAERAIDADVVTAMPLAADGERALSDALGRATGRRVTVRARVDPAVLGGVVARVGSVVFDGSLAGQLERMKQRVRSGV